ncbi:hypothetical protein [Mycolicibacterium goodii]|uniref:hypothetical protein n=1 Tax=Mycolicibacterium goodii TaxID=134601 RepID=UPI0012FF8703
MRTSWPIALISNVGAVLYTSSGERRHACSARSTTAATVRSWIRWPSSERHDV